MGKDVYEQLRELETELEKVKMQHRIGAIGYHDAKERIKSLEDEVTRHVQKLPKHEQQFYMLKKEFGDIF